MKRFRIVLALFTLACVAAIYLASASTSAVHRSDTVTAAAAATCETKHCPPNTHCCYGCTGSPICVKNGVPCPECAPQ